MWEKSKETIEYDKRTIICNVGTTQCEDGTVKYKKKLGVFTQYDKRTVICDKSGVRCDVNIV